MRKLPFFLLTLGFFGCDVFRMSPEKAHTRVDAPAANNNREADDRSSPVDELTPDGVKDKVAFEYRHFGYDISGEKDNPAGWSATVKLGPRSSRGEAHIYKVMLVDIKGRTDGYKVASSLREEGVASESRVGQKKLLFVQCLLSRPANESGSPTPCSSYDSRIGSFASDLAIE